MSRRTLTFALLGLLGSAPVAWAAPPEEPVQNLLCRGTSAEGFSYWWGGECWCAAGCTPDLASCAPGACTANAGSTGCPDCTHTGTYGADCSGFVSKAWQVPDPHAVDACHVDRYVASSFTADHAYWDVVSMDSLQPGDAVASDSHVILVIGYEDNAGEHEVVEAKGCSYGIVRQSRTFASQYSGARRISLTQCTCEAGDEESRACGDCGTEARTCADGCSWSAWSACAGSDPTGDTTCAVDGGEGACAQGQRRCVAGWLTCQPQDATTEVCDGVDNDCDGIVDNGTAATLGEGYACQVGCADGVSQCVSGAVQCVVDGPTTCDATPDDPDGRGTGGCACTSGSSAGALCFLGMLLLLGWIRRRATRP
jgi:hypothetical protein